MLVRDKELIGEFWPVEHNTREWKQVDISWIEYELHYDQYAEVANKSRGLWTTLSDSDTACVRFQCEEDAKMFEREYLGTSTYSIAM